jgi:uncharacterized protein YjbI with pentapeptide repeats
MKLLKSHPCGIGRALPEGVLVVHFRALMQRPAVRVAGVVGIVLVLLAAYLRIVRGLVWAPGTGFESKTLWDWLQLLIIPAVLSLSAVVFSRNERKNEQKLAQERAREEALQTYIDKVTGLLLEHELRAAAASDEVSVIARARTLATLRMLDKDRKGLLLRFLHEAGLIRRGNPTFPLTGADLTKANLRLAVLTEIELVRVNLSGSDLNGAILNGANLAWTELEGSDLSMAELSRADLSWTVLRKANLPGADLSGAKVRLADLAGANLLGANLTGADLSGANLSKADLRGADLSGAVLGMADPTEAELAFCRVLGIQLCDTLLAGIKYDANTKWPAGYTYSPNN